MRKEKKTTPSTRKDLPPARPAGSRDVLKNIEEENEMIDDHGPVIIGRRDKKPILPDDDQS